MQCPKCNKSTQVLDSRPDGRAVKRRRKCKSCGFRFATTESIIKQAKSAKRKGLRISPYPVTKPHKTEPKERAYEPPKNRGRDLDEIWDDIADAGDGLSLRELGLD